MATGCVAVDVLATPPTCANLSWNALSFGSHGKSRINGSTTCFKTAEEEEEEEEW